MHNKLRIPRVIFGRMSMCKMKEPGTVSHPGWAVPHPGGGALPTVQCCARRLCPDDFSPLLKICENFAHMAGNAAGATDPDTEYMFVRVVGGEQPGATFSQRCGQMKLPGKVVGEDVRKLTLKDHKMQRI